MYVVDPTDENVAILNDGQIGIAVRLVAIENPEAPTVAELNAASSIIGYGSFTFDASL